MNKQPIYYMQTDKRWKNNDYSAKGEKRTIGSSGCGPTCAAMIIATLKDSSVTPVETCRWALSNGYKALNQGTYYSYFIPQFKKYNIGCIRLNTSNLYGNRASSVHTRAFDLLKQGYYLIACMGKGNWTTSGHFVVVWEKDGKVRINDPYSQKSEKINGDIDLFKSQVKYYWAIDATEYNNAVKESKTIFFDAYTGKSSSIVDALNAMGESSSYTKRKEIAKANGISNYTGAAKQNSEMLKKLKAGTLIKP